ncbi:unnamed protein product [Dicrocoelium dendriticum]|nr:unnamed protein product [Dicrocoelium dendriticum]
MLTSKCLLLLLAITFAPCELVRQHAIRIAMGIVGDDLTGEWRSVYGSATEVLHIAETACLKFVGKVAILEELFSKPS